MLGYLASAHCFLKATASSRNIGEEESRTELIAECARIGAFLQGSRHPSPSFSVFDPQALIDARTPCAEFLRHVSEEAPRESAYRELLLLFECVAQVNAALLRDLQAQAPIVKKVKALMSQEEEQRKEISQLLPRLGSCDAIQQGLRPVLSQYVADPPSSLTELSERFIERFDGSQMDGEALMGQVAELGKYIRRLERQVQRQSARTLERRSEFCEDAQELVDSMENELITREEAEQAQADKERQIKAQKRQLARQTSLRLRLLATSRRHIKRLRAIRRRTTI
jgi:hypothetical protein